MTSGGTVTWTWGAAVADHNVTFADNTQNSPTQAGPDSHTRTFPTVTVSTTFRYRCTLHSANFTSGMSGEIIVVP